MDIQHDGAAHCARTVAVEWTTALTASWSRRLERVERISADPRSRLSSSAEFRLIEPNLLGVLSRAIGGGRRIAALPNPYTPRIPGAQGL